MNPLQEYPHLFASPEGIFKYKAFREIRPLTYRSLPAIEHGEFEDNWSHCTLIARPIENMTDGEGEDIYNASCEVDVNLSHDSCDMMREFWEQRTKSGNLKFSTARWMLKIGVYPFDQNHFEDGIVIDSREI